VVFALSVEDVASPLESVVTVQVVVGELELQPDEAKLPLAPELGALNVTETPGTGLPSMSFTTATSLFEKAVPTVADCPEPETTAMLVAAPEETVTVRAALLAVQESHTAVTV
jgi:hypothetical protein